MKPEQLLIFFPSDNRTPADGILRKSEITRKVGVYIERCGIVDDGIYAYFPHIPVLQAAEPRPVRIALEAVEPAEWDLINDGVDVPIILVPPYLRPKVKKSSRRLFLQTFRVPMTVLGAKGQEIRTVGTVQFIQQHTKEEDPAPTGYFTDEQRHHYNLNKAENGDRMQGKIRGVESRALWKLENDESMQLLNLAERFRGGTELEQLAELRIRFVLMEQTAESFRRWTGISERYLAHLDRFIRKEFGGWDKVSLYPRSESGFLTRISDRRPRNVDRIIRKALKTGLIPAESIDTGILSESTSPLGGEDQNVFEEDYELSHNDCPEQEPDAIDGEDA